jgi:AcrR family transcriptional regulator
MSVTQRSVTSTARRAQIVAATIEVISEEGFGQATFGRIATRADLSSTRLISYHFASKDELIDAVVREVFDSIGSYMYLRMSKESDARGMLRAYIEGTIEYTATHRAPMSALMKIVLAGALRFESLGDDGPTTSHIEAILRRGQAEGQFREFDPAVVGAAIQRSVEGLPFLLETDPGMDCDGFARELVTLYELGTRRSES